MEEKFTYTYSATENKELQEIRKKYLPKEENKLEELKELDRRVQNAGMVESLCVGILGCLIFGVAMCMGLEVLAGGIVLAVLVGLIGSGMMFSAYPIYRKVFLKVKEANANRILQLAEEIENGL